MQPLSATGHSPSREDRLAQKPLQRFQGLPLRGVVVLKQINVDNSKVPLVCRRNQIVEKKEGLADAPFIHQDQRITRTIQEQG